MKKKVLTTALLSALLLGACAQQPIQMDPDVQAAYEKRRLELRDNLQEFMTIEELRTYRANNGDLSVEIRGSSKATFDNKIRIRCLWFGDNGAPIKTMLSNWQVIDLESNRGFEMKFAAPGNGASDYRVEIAR